ncbi:MAG: hypothetical protein KC476_02665 [Cyanobacteria bacterium HKST-UBA06]|nr:hypothetical protein [Cyanobacteria bacterium HKST-UBA06]
MGSNPFQYTLSQTLPPILPSRNVHYPLSSSPSRLDLAVKAPEPARLGHEPSVARRRPLNFKKLAMAAGAVLLGLGLGRLKARMPAQSAVGSLLPTDWKTYAQIASGVVAVRSFNSALDVQPPAWLTAVETSALLHPMTLGIKGHALRHLPVMAAYVGSVVGVTNWAVNAFDDHVGRDNHIPRWVPKLVLWATAVVGGAKLYPALARQVAKSGMLGEALQREARNGSAFVQSALGGGAAAGMMCANGCCPTAICAVEVGDALGSLFSGHLATHAHERQLHHKGQSPQSSPLQKRLQTIREAFA